MGFGNVYEKFNETDDGVLAVESDGKVNTQCSKGEVYVNRLCASSDGQVEGGSFSLLSVHYEIIFDANNKN